MSADNSIDVFELAGAFVLLLFVQDAHWTMHYKKQILV